eukprot:Gb_04168 [translate_table: standard]
MLSSRVSNIPGRCTHPGLFEEKKPGGCTSGKRKHLRILQVKVGIALASKCSFLGAIFYLGLESFEAERISGLSFDLSSILMGLAGLGSNRIISLDILCLTISCTLAFQTFDVGGCFRTDIFKKVPSWTDLAIFSSGRKGIPAERGCIKEGPQYSEHNLVMFSSGWEGIPTQRASSLEDVLLLGKAEEEEEYQKSDEEGNADVVWENLQEIFEDIDARSEGLENKQQLKKPIMHLRRLLQMHSKIRTEEIELEEMLLGVSYEREWYLRKLQAVEAVIAAPESCLSRSSPSSSALSWLNDGAVQSLIKAISIILYEDNEDFSLVGSKLPVSYNM